MNAYEINMVLRGLNSLETDMCREWEKAQKASPYGCKATSIFDELRVLRELADKLAVMLRPAEPGLIDNKFKLRLVNPGDAYGLNDALINEGEPMIEFYDGRQDPAVFGERGQFITRYNVSTLIKRGAFPSGLALDMGIPAWSVSADGMAQVMQFLQEEMGAVAQAL